MTNINEDMQKDEGVKQLSESDFFSDLSDGEQDSINKMDQLANMLPEQLMENLDEPESAYEEDDKLESDEDSGEEDTFEEEDGDDEEDEEDIGIEDEDGEEEEIIDYDDDLKSYTPEIRKLVMSERLKAQNEIELLKKQAPTSSVEDSNSKDELRATKLTALTSMEELAKIKLAESRRKRVVAIEEGDTEVSIEAEDEYHRNRDLYNKITNSKESLEREIAEQKKSPTTNVSSNNNGVTNEGSKWLVRNAELFEQRPDIYQAVLSLDGKFKGGNPNAPAYFDKFNKVLSTIFPDVKLQGTKKNHKKNPKKKTSAVAGARGAPLESRKKKSFKAGRESNKMLEALGLDTSDPEVMKIAEQERRKLYKK